MSNNLQEKNYQEQRGLISERDVSEAEHSELKDLKAKIEHLESQLKKERPLAGQEKEKTIKQEIKTYLQELQQPPSFAAPLAVRDETDEIAKFPAGQQVETLISLAFDKGLKKAISTARGLNNPAVLDEFHDILVDRYYNELIDKKILKP